MPNAHHEKRGLQTANGVSTFDLLSIDIADRDSGETGVWWDPTNKASNSFNRFLRYAATLASETQRRIVFWQVPIGNQVYQTENNAQGHYQDNKAQHILAHVADFARAGVVMTLFGAGGIEGSHVNDTRGDGITNPRLVSSYQCDRCNQRKSEYADDDGGYLRLTVGQYYKNAPYPLPGNDFQPAVPHARAQREAQHEPRAVLYYRSRVRSQMTSVCAHNANPTYMYPCLKGERDDGDDCHHPR